MIKQAFNILYAHGLICRAAVPGQKQEVAAKIAQRAAERKQAGEPVSGAVFFMASEMKNGTYPLYFGPIQGHGLPPEHIGAMTVKAIRQTGGWCEWDGDPEHVIVVKEN